MRAGRIDLFCGREDLGGNNHSLNKRVDQRFACGPRASHIRTVRRRRERLDLTVLSVELPVASPGEKVPANGTSRLADLSIARRGQGTAHLSRAALTAMTPHTHADGGCRFGLCWLARHYCRQTGDE
jgi:hypothetical protein